MSGSNTFAMPRALGRGDRGRGGGRGLGRGGRGGSMEDRGGGGASGGGAEKSEADASLDSNAAFRKLFEKKLQSSEDK